MDTEIMGTLCALRKRRHHPVIDVAAPVFSERLHAGDYEGAAKAAIWTVLKMNGADLVPRAIDAANSYLKRQKFRRGL